MRPSTVLHLVRHGESLGNVNPALRRAEDPGLTDRGRAQAAAAAGALSRLGLDALVSSPLRRARETAEPIRAATGLAEVEVVEALREVDMGSLAEAPERRAERDALFAAWLAGERGRGFPGGEDFAAVMRRVGEALRALAEAAPGGRVGVVTHRMPIAAAAALCEPARRPPTTGACANGSLTTLRAEGEGRFLLLAWGDGRHLDP